MKLLILLAGILVLSFAGLSFFIIRAQTTLLLEMRENVDSGLKTSGKESAMEFDRMKGTVESLLTSLKEKTTSNLSASTKDALLAEESRLRKGMEDLLLKNGESIAELLNSVAPSLIMAEDFASLVKYSQASAQTEAIVFALFLDKDKNPLPGYINLIDDRIIGYLKQGQGDDETMKVINQAKKDPDVLILEKPILYYNITIGTTLVCISRDSVNQQLSQLSQRFEALRYTNEAQIQTTIDEESSIVITAIGKDIETVTRKNAALTNETSALLNNSAQRVTSSIKTVISVVGAICFTIILCLIGLVFHVLVIIPIKTVAAGLKDTAEGEGDLTKRLSLRRTDELGILAGWFDAFLERLNLIISDINHNAKPLLKHLQPALNLLKK